MADLPAPSALTSPARTVADCVALRQDNFLLLRFLAASLVIFGHCWAVGLNPSGETDWLGQRTLLFSGTLAVNIFFFISGFLVTMSYQRRHSLWIFVKARALRIFPALMVCVTFTAVVLGPLVSELRVADYFADPHWLRYLLGNISMLDRQENLPGVFTHNRLPDIVNGSLWTIPIELCMYVFVAALGVAGLLRTRLRFGLAIVAMLLVVAAFRVPLQVERLALFYGPAAFFVIGACCWMARDSVPVSGYGVLLLLFACAVFYRQPGYPLVFGALTAYGSLWLVFVPGLQGFNRIGDYSYGLYLYGFVMQQLVAHGFPQFGPYRLFAASFPLALLAAIVSWHGIEKPALRWK